MITSARHVPTPRIADAHLAYEVRAWVAYDVARPGVEVEVKGINEHQARVAGGLALSLPAWRVRVRPSIGSLRLA